jgi:hypothetical protein
MTTLTTPLAAVIERETMVTQYVYDGFEGDMSEKECGDYVSVDVYFALEEQHNTFMDAVRFALDTFITADTASAEDDQNLVNNLEAAFRAQE